MYVCVPSWYLFQTLYTYPESFRASKALIAARYSGADVKVVSEPPEFELGKTNKTEDFLAKFPLGKVRQHVISGLVSFQSLIENVHLLVSVK